MSKFKEDKVTLEKKIENDLLPRPIDCWVETKSGNIAYWIIPSQIKPVQRKELKQVFEQENIQINWVFLSEMLHEEKDEPGNIHLTTTEREFMHLSEYNEFIDRHGNFYTGSSLHYLDSEQETLTTFRTLRIVHSPQLYGGRKQVHKISEVLVLPKTGEFVHPGEHEYLQKTKPERERIKKRLEELERQYQVRLEGIFRDMSRYQSFESETVNNPVRSTISTPIIDNQEGTCILCGEVKREWSHITSLGKRICKSCYGGN